MDASLLEQIGLNTTQARAYLALISSGTLTPPLLSDKIQITRTNAYEILKQLEELKLAVKSGNGSKLTYRPENPANLEKLMESRRNQVIEHETRLRNFMPQLMTYFYTFSEQPGVRFYQGKTGLIQIYEDMLRTRQPIRLIRTPAENDFLGSQFMSQYIAKRTKLNITVEALTPRIPDANRDPNIDAQHLLNRTWYEPQDYQAPVEIDIYGDKVAFISFGHEAMGTIIESPQIAQAMRQVFALMKRGAKQSSISVAATSPAESEPSAQTPLSDQSAQQTPLSHDADEKPDPDDWQI